MKASKRWSTPLTVLMLTLVMLLSLAACSEAPAPGGADGSEPGRAGDPGGQSPDSSGSGEGSNGGEGTGGGAAGSAGRSAEPADSGDAAENPAETILAEFPAPPRPVAAILEGSPSSIANWFIELEAWMQQVVLLPNTMGERGLVADQSSRDAAKQALTMYYSPQYAEALFEVFWEPKEEDGRRVYTLTPTEGPALLPFMETVEVVEVDDRQVVIHGSNEPPALWEEVTLAYQLVWVSDGEEFRINRTRHIQPDQDGDVGAEQER